jgi:hypothetical protein
LPDEVVSARERQHEADAAIEAIVTARIEAHLHVMAAVLDTLRDQHKRVVEETDFEPLEKTRQSAAWLIAGRCISLGYAIVVCLRAGVTTDVAPLVRTLHEANGALRIMMNADETKLHRKWLRDGYFSANDLRLAQKRMEDSAAVEMLMRGVAPPGRTDELDGLVYGQWSRIAHNRRSGILESYQAALREFAYGTHPDPLFRGVWAGYGAHVMHEVTITVGAMLTKVFGRHLWMAYIEPAISALDRLQREHPLNPSALGFKESQ